MVPDKYSNRQITKCIQYNNVEYNNCLIFPVFGEDLYNVL